MFGLPMNVLLLAVLSALFVMSIMFVLLMPRLNTEKKTAERYHSIRNKREIKEIKQRTDDAAKRRRNVQETLKEIEQKNSKKQKTTLSLKLKQAGLTISKPVFFVLSGVSALIFGVIGLIAQVPIIVTLGLLFFGAVGAPQLFLSFMKKRRIKMFTDELPDAVDIIVRGIKAGLPLNDGLRLVAAEAKDPVASEFRSIVETQQLGVPMSEAVQRLADNIPTPETSFFATVIAIQQNSGGSLSEALANLSKILRDRKKMRAKVKAISSEAKASAGIIGSLPIFVATIVSLISPGYMTLLFTTSSGHVIIAIGVLMMTAGTLVMRKMINFEI